MPRARSEQGRQSVANTGRVLPVLSALAPRSLAFFEQRLQLLVCRFLSQRSVANEDLALLDSLLMADRLGDPVGELRRISQDVQPTDWSVVMLYDVIANLRHRIGVDA